MTVIVYRDGVLAADRCHSVVGTKQEGRKLFQAKEGAVAIAGAFMHSLRMMHWFTDGAVVADFPDDILHKEEACRLIYLSKAGLLAMYENNPYPNVMDSEYGAWGCGREVALGALFHGATAVEAVLAANHHAEGCGFGVDTYEVERRG